jgi:hypothetical protein
MWFVRQGLMDGFHVEGTQIDAPEKTQASRRQVVEAQRYFKIFLQYSA